MSDRYMGMIKCPYCNEKTEYLFNDEWGREQWCDNCKKKFIIEMELVAKKIKQKNGSKKGKHER